jgi:hypothetical protein
MSLKLVESGLTKAVMFSPNGEMLQPSEVLYNRGEDGWEQMASKNVA